MNRRDLIRKIALGGTVFVFVPSIVQSCTKDTGVTTSVTNIILDLSLSVNSALNISGGSKTTQNVIIVNTGNDSFIAVSSICPHQGCTVNYDSPSGEIKCPCHNSVFTTSGDVVSGPAPSALQSFTVTKAGNILTITG
jgi:cytochrome b6-f complex iron-sulfur subunit